jgi:hypothetical protein
VEKKKKLPPEPEKDKPVFKNIKANFHLIPSQTPPGQAVAD